MSNSRHSARAPIRARTTGKTVSGREVLQARGVHDRRLLSTIEAVPAQLFGLNPQGQPASDDAGRSQVPLTALVALMVQALELRGNERVLDIGTGSGYQAALLGRLASQVYSVELDPRTSEAAARKLEKLGLSN